MKDEDKTKEELIHELEELKRSVDNLKNKNRLIINDERYNLLVENMLDVIFRVDANFILIDVSPSVEKLSGYTPDELIRKPFSELKFLSPESLENTYTNVKKILKVGQLPAPTEYEFITKDGKKKYIEVKSTPIMENGKFVELIAIARDITEHKKAKEKIIAERKRAEFYLDLLGHDINNYNQAIVSYNEMLSSRTDIPEDYRKYSKNSLQQALEISELISKVEKLSQLQKGEYEIKKMNVIPILTRSTELLSHAFPDKNIEIYNNLPKNEMMIRGNDLLLEVFTNLLTNAVKYNKNPKILLDISNSISDDGKYWKFEFKDNGPGIPDKMKQQIFKRFERDKNTVQGRGLGLTIVREVIDQIGGEVWVEDKVKGNSSQGSNFVVFLPKED